MLTVLVATARTPRCYTHHPEWDQFDNLARYLGEQTYRDFELVVVTPFADEVKQTLTGRVERFTVVQPRDTPWRRAKMFAVASARNTGLSHARGAWVLTIDDCTEFAPDFLRRVVDWADQGYAVSVMYRQPDGKIHDGRWPDFQKRAGSKQSITIRGEAGPTPQGYISFPMSAAVAVNGYDELRFDGARGLEDMNFARRLMVHGVPFVMDRNIIVALHNHIGYPKEVIDNEDQNARCCNTAHMFAKMGEANRVRYTPEEKQKILHCMYWRDDGKCGYHKFVHACAYPRWAKDGHPVALRVLLNDEEELFDLAAARRANGIS